MQFKSRLLRQHSSIRMFDWIKHPKIAVKLGDCYAESNAVFVVCGGFYNTHVRKWLVVLGTQTKKVTEH